jgi:hypothetical protein
LQQDNKNTVANGMLFEKDKAKIFELKLVGLEKVDLEV